MNPVLVTYTSPATSDYETWIVDRQLLLPMTSVSSDPDYDLRRTQVPESKSFHRVKHIIVWAEGH